jgi:hypothetical protein
MLRGPSWEIQLFDVLKQPQPWEPQIPSCDAPIVKQKVDPAPSSDSTQVVPPRLSTTLL